MIEPYDSLCEFFFQNIRMFSGLQSSLVLCDFFECRRRSELEVGDDEIILDRYELLIHALWCLIDRDRVRGSLRHLLSIRSDKQIEHHDILFRLSCCFLESATCEEIEVLLRPSELDVRMESDAIISLH